MRIRIEATAAELADLEIVEIGDEAATACDSRGFERERSRAAAERGAVIRARCSPSLSIGGPSVALLALGDWLDGRRGWRHQIVIGARAYSSGGPIVRNYVRATFTAPIGPLAELEVWIDFQGATLRALLPPRAAETDKAIGDSLDALCEAVEALGLDRAHHKII